MENDGNTYSIHNDRNPRKIFLILGIEAIIILFFLSLITFALYQFKIIDLFSFLPARPTQYKPKQISQPTHQFQGIVKGLILKEGDLRLKNGTNIHYKAILKTLIGSKIREDYFTKEELEKLAVYQRVKGEEKLVSLTNISVEDKIVMYITYDPYTRKSTSIKIIIQ